MSKTTMIALATIALGAGLALFGNVAHPARAAAANDAPDDAVAQLTARVTALEQKVADLEKRGATAAAPAGAAQPGPEALANRDKARERMRADLKQYTKEQMQQVETLYQPSNDRAQRGSETVKASLEKLIADFPDSNRAGCAVLYLAQWLQGEEREKRLTEAFEKHDDAFYGDGCQVGPYARFQLAAHYLQQKQPEKAKAQYDEIKKNAPSATDHAGATLASQIPG